MNKDKIIEKYKEKIKEIYASKDDNEVAHCIRDDIYDNLLRDLGFEELADLLIKAKDEIGFWYA